MRTGRVSGSPQARSKSKKRRISANTIEEGKGSQVGLPRGADRRNPSDGPRHNTVDEQVVPITVRNFAGEDVHLLSITTLLSVWLRCRDAGVSMVSSEKL